PQQYYTLNSDGMLTPNNNFQGRGNQNFNTFNVDMVYTWEFRPGSFIYIAWKNNIENYETSQGYFKNLGRTLASRQNNNLSFRIIYYLDYLKFRKKSTA